MVHFKRFTYSVYFLIFQIVHPVQHVVHAAPVVSQPIVHAPVVSQPIVHAAPVISQPLVQTIAQPVVQKYISAGYGHGW